MNATDEILEYAKSLFDVTGVGELDGERLLIFGLESTPERDLDDFGHRGEAFLMYGFKAHVAPRLESLAGFIHARGYHASALKRYGYPLQGEVNLKGLAVRAGLGKRGKSSVVLHPRYGTRLRWIGMRTDAPLPLSRPQQDAPSPFCRDCKVCLDVCPVKVLEPYRMTDPGACLSNISRKREDGRSILCDECLRQCPANQS